VGGRSKSEKLERFNLRNQEDSRARGAEVGKVRAAVEALKDKINSKLDELKESRKAR
jgi:hypothetical protein